MRHTILPITTIVSGLVPAFILGMTTNKLRISPLVGYPLASVLAGPFTPNFVADIKLTPELAGLSAILLMFGVGLHFSLKDLMAVEFIAIPGAIAQIAVATLLDTALSIVLGWLLMMRIAFGLCLSTASTMVLLRALEERQSIDNQRGQTIIGWLIIEDLMMMLALVLLPTVTGTLEKEDVGSVSLVADMGITIGRVVAFTVIMMLTGRRLVPWIITRNVVTGSRELFTLPVFALALGVVLGTVELFDVFLALGTFFVGTVLNESGLGHRAAHDILSLCDVFTVLFFVSVGVLFDSLVLIQQSLAVLGTLAIIIFGESFVAYFLMRLSGHSQRTTLVATASLAQIDESAFIPAGLGMALDLLPQAGRNLVLTETVLSIMPSLVLPAVLEKYLAKTETLERQTLEETIEEEKQISMDIRNYALLVGFDRAGSLLGEKSMTAGIPLVVIETSRTWVDELCERGIRAVPGNAASEETMNLAHLDCTRWLLLTIPDGYEAGETAASACEKCPSIEIIACAHYNDEVEYIAERGVSQVVMDEREIARTMLELIETPPASKVAMAN